MARTGGGRGIAAAGAALLTAVLALSGCSQAGSSGKNSTAGAAMPRAAAGADASGTAGGGGTGGTGAAASTGTASSGTVAVQPTGRALIYTGEMQLRASGLDAAVSRAEQLVGTAGGYVDSEQTGPVNELSLTSYPAAGGSGDTGDTGGSDSSLPLRNLPQPTGIGAQGAQLVLRIPATRYSAVFQQLLSLGTDLGEERTSQDVTAQVVDVASRISSQQASVDRVRALMDRAQSLSDVVSLEAALTQRESALESLQAQQRSLASQTAMSTVTVQIYEPPSAPAAAPAHRAKSKGVGSAAAAALADGWHGLYETFRALLLALSALLPFALPLVPLGWLALRLTRRRLRARPTAVAAGPLADGADE